MKKTRIIKIIVDLAMYILFLLLMGQHLISGAAHEWLGISLFAFFLLHNALNYKWYAALFRGKYTANRVVQTVVNFLLMIAMIGCVISSMLISGTVFAWLDLGGAEFGRKLHMLSTAWAFVLMSVHLGLHFSSFVSMARKMKLPATAKVIVKWLLRAMVLAIGIFDIVVFARRAFYEELFLLTAFKFFDYEKTAFVYLLDTTAMSGSFVGMTYYLKKFCLIKKNNYKNGATY